MQGCTSSKSWLCWLIPPHGFGDKFRPGFQPSNVYSIPRCQWPSCGTRALPYSAQPNRLSIILLLEFNLKTALIKMFRNNKFYYINRKEELLKFSFNK